MPPNPNELVSATSARASRPSCGMQSRSQAGSGASRLSVGGSHSRATASAEIAAAVTAKARAGALPNLVVDPVLPEAIGHLELLDIPGRWGRLDAFGRGRVHVEHWHGNGSGARPPQRTTR